MLEYHNKNIINSDKYCLCLVCPNIEDFHSLNIFISELNKLQLKYNYKIFYLYKYSYFAKNHFSKIFDNILLKENTPLDIFSIKHFLTDSKVSLPETNDLKVFTPSEESFYFNFNYNEISRFI